MSELGSHKGEGNRYVMYLSAPAGGIAQMLRDPEGNWVPHEDYAQLKAEVERLKQQVNYYAIEAKDFEDKWLTAIEVVTNLMKPRSEVGLVPPCIDKYEAK
jgi:hypothetical protein